MPEKSVTRSLPVARTPDPIAAPPLRWGIIGTGWIAQRFVQALHAWTTQRVTAAGSRGPARAQELADRLDIPLPGRVAAGLLLRSWATPS